MILNDVIVVSSYYNDLASLKKTLLSINESVDVLVVDDCSKESIYNFEEELIGLNTNIKLYFIRNSINIGLTKSCNVALKWLENSNSYKYYCRLDSGDQFVGDKLKKQKEFLENNPDYVMVGTYAKAVDSDQNYLYDWVRPSSHDEIVREMKVNSPCIHSTFMVRLKELTEIGGYNEKFPVAQDFELLSRLYKKGKIYNIPEFLLNYEVATNSITTKKRKKQIYARIKVQMRVFDFSYLSLWGLLRSFILLFVSRELASKIKNKK